MWRIVLGVLIVGVSVWFAIRWYTWRRLGTQPEGTPPDGLEGRWFEIARTNHPPVKGPIRVRDVSDHGFTLEEDGKTTQATATKRQGVFGVSEWPGLYSALTVTHAGPTWSALRTDAGLRVLSRTRGVSHVQLNEILRGVARTGTNVADLQIRRTT